MLAGFRQRCCSSSINSLRRLLIARDAITTRLCMCLDWCGGRKIVDASRSDRVWGGPHCLNRSLQEGKWRFGKGREIRLSPLRYRFPEGEELFRPKSDESSLLSHQSPGILPSCRPWRRGSRLSHDRTRPIRAGGTERAFVQQTRKSMMTFLRERGVREEHDPESPQHTARAPR
jgi:hypothetical protein